MAIISVSGIVGDTSFHADIQLVIGQHLLPHDNRQPGPRLETALRDLFRLQDGRLADLLHFSNVK